MELHHAIKRRGAHGYFASANSSRGFYSLFGEVFSEEKHKSLYILKGGPGTGKSTLLDGLAARAEREGYEFEALLCSSDPTSLDGIVIESLGVAVLDGTAPHSQDPYYPGVCGEIINLGSNWNAEKLHRSRGDIEVLFRDKSEAYSRAYRLLEAAGIAERDVIHAYERAADTEKMDAAVKRLLRQLIGRGSGMSPVVRRFTTAHSVIGKVYVNTLDTVAETTVTVSRSHGFGYLYMRSLYDLSVSLGCRMTAIPDALLPEYYEAIYYPDEAVLVKLADEDEYERGDVRINCSRFILSDVVRGDRAKLRFSEKMCANLTDEAILSLEGAGKIHSKIEEIYKASMNFDGVSDTARKLETRIFG